MPHADEMATFKFLLSIVVTGSSLIAAASDALPPTLSRIGDGAPASVYRSLEFVAEAGKPIAVGTIADVRLERVGPHATALALVSHWQSSDTRLYDPSAQVDALRIHLRDPRWRRRPVSDESLKPQRHPAKQRVVDLHFAALLSPGESYRLSWTCRVEDKEPVVAHCEFTTLGLMAEGEHPDLSQLPVSSTYTYLCEVLLRDDDGNLFLGRQILPLETRQWGRVPLLSFDAAGKAISPPSDREPLRRLRTLAVRLEPPSRELPRLVEAIGYAGVQILHDGQRFWVSGSCERTHGSLPIAENDIAYVFFGDTICRMQRWSENVVALREDRALWQSRTAELQAEILRRFADGEQDFTEESLSTAAFVLRDPELLRCAEQPRKTRENAKR